MNSEKYWSQYWLQGNKTSFGDTFQAGYEGTLKQEWGDFFSTINPKCSVLDLCTGNASLIRIAATTLSYFNQITFTGVDYASILNDDFIAKHKNVDIKSKVNIENLPFDDNSYDFIISNYGIEYSDIYKSTAEAARILKKNGLLNILCHYHDSVLIKDSKDELKYLTSLLTTNGVLNNLELLLTSLNKKNNEDERECYRAKLNDEMNLLANSYGNYFYKSDFMSFFKFLFSAKATDKSIEFNDFKNELLGYKYRINSMVSSALTPEKITKIKACFKDNKLKLMNEKSIEHNGNIIGYKISAKKII